MHRSEIKPGQQWRSKDKRDNGRIVTIGTVDPTVATFGTGFVHVRSTRWSRMHWRSLVERYELVTDTTESAEEATK